MTDVALPSAPDTETEGNLPLEGAGPFTVNVKVDDEGIPYFAAPGSSVSFTDITWTPSKGAASASITFVFVGHNPISRITSSTAGLTFGNVSHGQQVASCSSTPGDYNFTIYYTTGDKDVEQSVDPIIVVTIPPLPDDPT